ncbi:type II secretion system F family protein [Microcella daejeonensis]|uniref:Type II secretion system F family protein n=1 Tax=Microcella daejeonensis TaxID=2994971 RepID=A0A9E8MN08_9MICO|nr:type II secretion system F family protein [Microcella daejeonensis]WAB82644.1 type II secretion system F family protein [Microcella daejeonensis]
MTMTSQSMKTWAYSARDASGKIVKGKLDAPTESAVVARLRTMGIAPIAIDESSATGLQREITLPGFEKRVKLKDLAVASRQMATMLASGLSLLRTLTILSQQTENPKLAEVLGKVRSDVETGSSLSDALHRHPLIFPRLMIHLIKAGETGGFLDRSLESIANNFEADVKLRQTIKSALTYPIAVLCMAFAAVIAMMIFIVPIFKAMFEDFDSALPLPTQILVTLSENMIWIVPVLVVVIVGFTVWWRRNKHTDEVRSKVDPLVLKMPVFGQLFRKVAIARFSRNFATMMAAGVPILQSLAIVGETSGNWVIEQALVKVQDSVRTGRSIAAPLTEEPIFPAMVTQMVSVGEDSGSLEIMLEKVADFYDEEVQSTAESLTSLIEPLMIGVIGVVIGGMIVALYMPVFSIFNEIG